MSQYFMHHQNGLSQPIYWRSTQLFAGIPIHINLNLLSESLGDPIDNLIPTFQLVPRAAYDVGSPIGPLQVQPRVITDGTSFRELPIGPRLKNFLDYPLRNFARMDLRPPFYDTSLGIGDSGGGWFRNVTDDSAWHGGIDITQGADNSLFQVCTAARGEILSLRRSDNSPVVIKHDVGNRSFLTIYQHLDLSGSNLRTGQVIGRGEPLARISNTPSTPHLHFMVAALGTIKLRELPITRIPAWFAIDAFGVYDYYQRRTSGSIYNYLPDLRPNCWNRRIQGANHPIQWENQPLSSLV